MCAKATMEEFEALLNESLEIDTPAEGSVVTGKVIAIEAGQAIIDVGYKMEGRVDLKEFANPGEPPKSPSAMIVEVYLERVENARGEAVVSREKARREAAWDRLEKAYADERPASTARSSAASRAASPSIWAVPWPSCPAARSMCARCAMPAR
jgi:small subunit ribosomal protein S1